MQQPFHVGTASFKWSGCLCEVCYWNQRAVRSFKITASSFNLSTSLLLHRNIILSSCNKPDRQVQSFAVQINELGKQDRQDPINWFVCKSENTARLKKKHQKKHSDWHPPCLTNVIINQLALVLRVTDASREIDVFFQDSFKLSSKKRDVILLLDPTKKDSLNTHH